MSNFKPRGTRAESIEMLRKLLVKLTNCRVQSGLVEGEMSESGWPCGTCFMDMLNHLGLDDEAEVYKEHNELIDGHPDRHNEVWRAILQIRESKV